MRGIAEASAKIWRAQGVLLRDNMRMTTMSRLAFGSVLGLAIAVVGTMASGVAAQGQQACGLLTSDEIQALAPQMQVSAGVASAFPGLDASACRYGWGDGTGHFTLVLSVHPASRMFAGMNADAIKQYMVKSVTPETTDESIPDVGEAAVFKSGSSVYATASAYVKDRVLLVTLDGLYARDRKAELIALLKSAAERL
jgi:hypothetical protein